MNARRTLVNRSNNLYYIATTFTLRVRVVRALDRRLALAKPDAFESSSGIGVHRIVEGKRIALGDTSTTRRL
jgi:hypothetical protein